MKNIAGFRPVFFSFMITAMVAICATTFYCALWPTIQDIRSCRRVIADLKNEDFTRSIWGTLSQLKGDRGEQAVLRTLHAALKDVDTDVRTRATKVLGEIASARRELVTPVPEMKAEIVSLLAEALKDPSDSVRLAAVGSLAENRLVKLSEPYLISALDDENSKVQQFAYSALRSITPATGSVTAALRRHDLRVPSPELAIKEGRKQSEQDYSLRNEPGSTLTFDPDDPVCPGWENGWKIFRYSVRQNQWGTWTSPPARLPKQAAFWGAGPRGVAFLDPDNHCAGWFFSFDSCHWSEIPRSPISFKSPFGITKAGTTRLVDDRLIVWCYTTASPQGAVLDLSRFEWHAIPDAPIRIRYRCLNAVIGNKLLVWGGFPNSDEIQDGAIFDLDKNAWEVMPGAPIYFMYGMVSAVWRDRFVVFGRWEARGGATFDPNSCTWEEIQEAPFDIPRQGACAVNADKLFLWSGSESKTKEGAVYDFVRREWNRIPAAPIPDRCLGFASPFGSKVVVWGGWRAERALPDGAIFDLESQTWKAIAELPGEISPEFHPGW